MHIIETPAYRKAFGEHSFLCKKHLYSGWISAYAVEGREDIDYEAGQEDMLQESIHTLANPVLTEPLNTISAQRLLKTLL